jgi:hypothetical protein
MRAFSKPIAIILAASLLLCVPAVAFGATLTKYWSNSNTNCYAQVVYTPSTSIDHIAQIYSYQSGPLANRATAAHIEGGGICRYYPPVTGSVYSKVRTYRWYPGVNVPHGSNWTKVDWLANGWGFGSVTWWNL